MPQDLVEYNTKPFRQVSKRMLARAIGYLQSCSRALPAARLHLISLYADLHDKEGWGPNVRVAICNRSYNHLVHYWKALQLHHEGRFWYPPECSHVLEGRDIMTLVTDASQCAWGAYLQQVGEILVQDSVVRGLFNEDQQLLWSTLREFDGLLGAL